MSTLKSSSTDLTINADGVGNDIIFQSNAGQIGSLTAEGVLTATSFNGSAASLTSIPAANITGTLPALSATNLTSIPAANITGTLPAISGASLTNLPADATKLPLAGGTLTGAITTLSITETETTKTASFTPNLTTEGTIFDVSGTITITMPSAAAGKSFTVIDSGSGTLSWGGTIKWPSATAPSPSGATIYSFISNGTNWYGMMAGTGFA